MALYDFVCECGAVGERNIPIAERDSTVVECPACGKRMTRKVVAPKLGKPAYQMQAVLNSGEHVAGHFGREAPIRRKG